ncbi:DEAD/DEAH box helicase [Enterococcus sp. 10A9_DIV0425]|uniref:DEAD/DEAH box helicase n=1 Tax=Candidatus Enterococcus wittei TaxID=1987383 RepID=A0A242JX93_9ENTE|nr:DEAD/DEAH box helicase [Enterococcus sp. 10A9_DIV0425]OTP09551.1 DEAD/DEAH box helicase [Enterococcus sp. 10A9_DIV0425]
MNEFVQKLPTNWQKKWESKGFTTPSLIQKEVFDELKNKESLIGVSPTGSGKTLAYLLPLLLNVSPKEATALLILASSQELAIQVAEVTREWAKELDLKVQSVVGGANVKRQVEGLKTKPEILVGTPGRVLELMKAKKIKAHQIKTVVFDEADQLFDEGNRPFIDQILRQAPTNYQLAFFSATADRSIDQIEKMTNRVLKVIDVTKEDDSRKGQNHYYIRVPARKNDDYLRRLAHVEGFQGLVFFNQLSELGAMEEKMLYRGIAVASLASDQNKLLRKAALDQFKEKKINVLLTTDVAARGLDIAELPYVVNIDVPLTEEAYLHRSGRTGRMGSKGSVITFVHEHTLRDLKRMVRNADIELEESFLYGGRLQKEAPEKEKSLPESKKTTLVSSPKKERIQEKAKPVRTKKRKNKQKKDKNKGARRK